MVSTRIICFGTYLFWKLVLVAFPHFFDLYKVRVWVAPIFRFDGEVLW